MIDHIFQEMDKKQLRIHRVIKPDLRNVNGSGKVDRSPPSDQHQKLIMRVTPSLPMPTMFGRRPSTSS